MTKFLANVALAGALMMVGGFQTALADSDDSDKLHMGVVDVRSILSESKQAKAISDKLQKEFSVREKSLISQDKALQEKVEKFKRDGAVMAEKERTTTERDLVNAQRELQRLQSEFNDDTTLRQQEEMQKFLEKVRSAVNAIAEKGKFDIIIHSDAAPFVNPRLDVTKQVVQVLDK